MKKLRNILLLVLVLAMLSVPVLAATGVVDAKLTFRNIRLMLDGETLTPTDANGKSTDPFIYNDSAYLPVRAVSEALGVDVSWEDKTSTVVLTSPESTEGLHKILVQNGDFDPAQDTNDGVYIAALTDKYFDGGVETGMEALLNAGKVYLNGIRLPDEAATYYMNGMPAIWQKDNGGWTWQAHDKLNSDKDADSNYTFEQARRRFVLAVSALRGTTMTVWAREGEETACRVDFFVFSGGQVEKIVRNANGTTTVWGVPIDATSYNTDGGPNDVQPRTVPSAQFDKTIEEGDTVIYWYDTAGWHMDRAVPVQGIMTSTGTKDINVGGKCYSDALVVRYNMQAGSRPGQFIGATNNLQLGDIPVTLWNTTTGYVLGISRMENAEKALRQGIEYAEAQLAGKTIVASEDGAGVRKTEYWVAESVKTAYDTALANAKTVLANADATNAQRDAATQALGAAYGTLLNGSRSAKGMQQGTN